MPFVDRRSLTVRAVRGRKGPPAVRFVRLLLWPLALVYRAALTARNTLYRLRVLGRRRLGVPVISVGNLTAGGTGKTPMVEWLVHWLLESGRKPAVLSRGYGAARPRELNDEAKLLARNTPDLIHVVDPDRVRGGRRAVKEYGADCLVLDDGFQHVRLERDLDIVLIDALDPFGGGRLLPAGALREPLTALKRAHVVGITRADLAGPDACAELLAHLRDYAPGACFFQAAYEPTRLDPVGKGVSEPPEWLRGKRVFAFCGLGNPAAFFEALERLEPVSLDGTALDDHTPYPRELVDRLSRKCAEVQAEAAVTTQKDAVKVEGQWPGPLPLLALRVRMRIMSGQAELTEALREVLRGTCARSKRKGR